MEKSTILCAAAFFSFVLFASASPDRGLTLDIVFDEEGHPLTKVYVGTPPVEVTVLIDPGSPLTYLPCIPCLNNQCHSMDKVVFNPATSSSFSPQSCSSPFCEDVGYIYCDNTTTTCLYNLDYNLDDYANGPVVTDNFMLDSVTFPGITFGCAHNYTTKFSLLGMNFNFKSLVSQMGFNTFSHCIPPMEKNAIGKLKFDNHTTFSEQKAISTTRYLVRKKHNVYWVNLKGVTVGDKTFHLKKNYTAGNIVFDAGTPVTILPTGLYHHVESKVKSFINLEPTPIPAKGFKLCYNTTLDFDVPSFTFHFWGADMKLNKLNTFVKASENLQCFATIPTDLENDTPVIGSYAQVNFQVEYDLRRHKINFAPTECTKL